MILHKNIKITLAALLFFSLTPVTTQAGAVHRIGKAAFNSAITFGGGATLIALYAKYNEKWSLDAYTNTDKITDVCMILAAAKATQAGLVGIYDSFFASDYDVEMDEDFGNLEE